MIPFFVIVATVSSQLTTSADISNEKPRHMVKSCPNYCSESRLRKRGLSSIFKCFCGSEVIDNDTTHITEELTFRKNAK